MSISINLKRLKELNHVTNKEIAKHVDCHESTISSYILGKTKPRHEMVERLANFFNVDVSEIDESLKPSNQLKKRRFKYTRPNQPSVKKTQAAYIAYHVNEFIEENDYTLSKFMNELSNEGISQSKIKSLLYAKSVPNNKMFNALENKFGLKREDIDPFFTNGKEIDFGKVIYYKMLSIITEANVKGSHIDFALHDRKQKFRETFSKKLNSKGKFKIPQYSYIVAISELFNIEPSEIDPFTNPKFLENFNKNKLR